MKTKASSIWERDPLAEKAVFAFPKPLKPTKEERKLHRMERKLEKAKQATQNAKQPSLSALKKSTQILFNRYIRLRDEADPCISCQKAVGPWQAGHYIAQGSSGFLRYNEENCNKQCVTCNLYKHANLIEYRIGLVQKIGRARVEELESYRHETYKYTREELMKIREETKEKIKNLNIDWVMK